MLKVHTKNMGTAAVLYLEGRIVTGETEILRNVVDSLPKTNAVILDFTQVSIVDAHGLGVMLGLRERTLEKGMRFELMNVSKPFSRVLEITRLNTVFKIISRVEFFQPLSRDLSARAA